MNKVSGPRRDNNKADSCFVKFENIAESELNGSHIRKVASDFDTILSVRERAKSGDC